MTEIQTIEGGQKVVLLRRTNIKKKSLNNVSDALINWGGFVECEAWLPNGSDLVAEEMGFGQGWIEWQ